MTPLARRRVGKTKLMLTALGFGGAPVGNLYAPLDDEAALAAIERAWAGGVRYFDTAPHYGQGLSEHRLGQALRRRPRGDFVLSTKVGRLMVPDPAAPREIAGYVGGLPFRPRYDYSYDGALRSLEHSLLRLGLAAVDIVFIHDIDRATHGDAQPQRFGEAMSGAYRALAKLRAAGAVGAIGLGVNDWQVCRAALDEGDFDCFLVAGRYTLLDQSASAELMPLCAARGIGLILGGPFNSGILATGAVPRARFDYRPALPEILARVARIEAVALRHGVALAAAALQFGLGHDSVASIVPGARSAAEVEANIALMAAPIPAAFWAELKHEGLLSPEAPLPRVGGLP
jgi:D-threo-aldose 1-dehydrogenase